MNELDLFRGDAVLITGNQNRETIGVVLVDETCSNDCLLINHVIQKNIGVHSDEFVLIRPCDDVKSGKRIYIKTINYDIQQNQDNLLKDCLRPYFMDVYRPIYKGDRFIIERNEQAIEFQVIDTDPEPYCIVVPNTVVVFKGEPLRRRIKRE